MRLANYIWCGAVLLIFIVVGGCATTAGYEQVLNTWVGASEASLVNSSWGIPDGSYQAGGRKYLTYNSSRAHTTPVSTELNCSTSHAGATYCNTSTYGGTTYNYSCKTTFYVENNRVIGYKFKGNDCTAVAPKTSGTPKSTVWCARKSGITQESPQNCSATGADWFRQKYYAEIEAERLKKSD